MRHKAIAQDLSWLKPARKWEAVLEALLTGSAEAKTRGAEVRTPVQTPENVARSEKTAALREEAKVSRNSTIIIIIMMIIIIIISTFSSS